ncbi:hypothetical protein [Streptomyces sp. NPDC127098]|uniref:hypothetical protein n=1 Tax=Streptomyces sp. NPDC127098 TaxID=3347137 RepID=UPI00366338B8
MTTLNPLAYATDAINALAPGATPSGGHLPVAANSFVLLLTGLAALLLGARAFRRQQAST